MRVLFSSLLIYYPLDLTTATLFSSRSFVQALAYSCSSSLAQTGKYTKCGILYPQTNEKKKTKKSKHSKRFLTAKDNQVCHKETGPAYAWVFKITRR